MIDDERMKLVTDIREKLNAFKITDDSRLDGDYIWHQCKVIRNIFIEKIFKETKRNVEDFYSRLTLTVRDYNISVATDHDDYEPDLPELKRALLPNLINMKGNIRRIGPADRTDEYVRVNLDSFFHLQGRDFTSEKTYYLPFKDRAFFSSTPADADDTPYTVVDIWCLLEDPADDPNWNSTDHTLVPKKYQILMEDMVVDNILKYHNKGILSRENDATDVDSNTER